MKPEPKPESNTCNCFVCGSKPKDHTCNEEAVIYGTKSGERFFFADKDKADKWFEENYMNTTSGSVACSICKTSMLDNAVWL